MACKIQTLKPPCGYNLEGVQRVFALDFEDFHGFKFDGDDLYAGCLVTAIYRTGDFVDFDTPDTAKYAATYSNGVYTHALDTFIGSLAAFMSSNLHLSLKRRYIVLFQTKQGKYYAFGYEVGAGTGYTSQTAEGVGSLLTFSGQSIYPLFEVTPEALTVGVQPITYAPLFIDDTNYCQTDGSDPTGLQQAVAMLMVSATTGEPLDVDAKPVSVTLKKQAIRLLQGAENPDEDLYEVVGTYAPGAVINGVPSLQLNAVLCIVGPTPAVIVDFDFTYFK